ncbi:phosphotransferase [Sodalis sp. RH15]|uniref:phosphotransferase n=1 Tax=Sodalis sp. RH15 TaxID=3394330 RepID=UPI0039B59EEF
MCNPDFDLALWLRRLLPPSASAGCQIEKVSGLSGESRRVRAGERDWLARQVTPHKRMLGADNVREYRILRQLSASGLAPRPVALIPRGLVVDWTPGESLSAVQWQECLNNGSLPRRIGQLHRLPRYGYPLALHGRYETYWQLTDPARRCPAWLRLHQRFMAQKPPTPLKVVPMHMDVHADNLIRDRQGAISLIDWEYAADGDFALELAALFRGNGLNIRQQTVFLAAYLACSGGFTPAAVTRQISAWLPWVDYLMLMWYEVRWHQTRQRQFLQFARPPRLRLGLPV